jgi:hypothetical protein
MEVVSLIISVSIPLSVTYSLLHFDFMGMGTSSSSIFIQSPSRPAKTKFGRLGELPRGESDKADKQGCGVQFPIGMSGADDLTAHGSANITSNESSQISLMSSASTWEAHHLKKYYFHRINDGKTEHSVSTTI